MDWLYHQIWASLPDGLRDRLKEEARATGIREERVLQRVLLVYCLNEASRITGLSRGAIAERALTAYFRWREAQVAERRRHLRDTPRTPDERRPTSMDDGRARRGEGRSPTKTQQEEVSK